jgi:hypothetical protein
MIIPYYRLRFVISSVIFLAYDFQMSMSMGQCVQEVLQRGFVYAIMTRLHSKEVSFPSPD